MIVRIRDRIAMAVTFRTVQNTPVSAARRSRIRISVPMASMIGGGRPSGGQAWRDHPSIVNSSCSITSVPWISSWIWYSPGRNPPSGAGRKKKPQLPRGVRCAPSATTVPSRAKVALTFASPPTHA